jgi:hypothetical protein
MSGVQRVVAVLGCLVLALLFQAPRLSGHSAGGEPYEFRPDTVVPAGDAPQFAERWDAARISILRYHELPSWNPWYCGGVALFGDPEAPFPGPLFLLTFFWLPAAIGMNVWFVVHLVVGALGVMRLAREAGANLAEQFIAAATVIGCSFFAYHFMWEHLSFAALLLLPWILWSQRRALKDRRWIVLEAALFAVAAWEGGGIAVPMMAFVAIADALARWGNRQQRGAALRAVLVTGALAALLAAPKLLSIARTLRGHVPQESVHDGLHPAEVLDALLSEAPPDSWGHPFAWDEYAAHVGWIPLALAVIGALAALLGRDERMRLRRIDLFLLAVALWAASGTTPVVSLWDGLHLLPAFSSLRVPSRFLFPAVLALALLAGHGLVFLRQNLARGRSSHAIGLAEWILVGLLAADLWSADVQAIATTHFRLPAPQSAAPLTATRPDFVQTAGADGVERNPWLGQGTRACYHPQFTVDVSPSLRVGPVTQQWIVPASAGSVEPASWSPNRLTYRVDLHAPARLVINQNADPGWSASEGRIGSESGLLAVDLEAGVQREVVLHHRSTPPLMGPLLLLVGLAWGGVLIRRRPVG